MRKLTIEAACGYTQYNAAAIVVFVLYINMNDIHVINKHSDLGKTRLSKHRVKIGISTVS